MNFFIYTYVKNGKYLCLNTNMRSNDLIYGTPYNVIYILRIYSKMFNKLKQDYKQLEYGEYRHIATSMRIYEHHGQIVYDIIGPKNFLA